MAGLDRPNCSNCKDYIPCFVKITNKNTMVIPALPSLAICKRLFMKYIPEHLLTGGKQPVDIFVAE